MSTSDSQMDTSRKSIGEKKLLLWDDIFPSTRYRALSPHRSSDEMTDDNYGNICEECKLIEFGSICDPKNAERYLLGRDVAEFGNRLQRADVNTCALCHLFASVQAPCGSQIYTLTAISSLWIFPRFSHLDIPKELETVLLAVGAKVDEFLRVFNWRDNVLEPCWNNGFLSRVNTQSLASRRLTGRVVDRVGYSHFRECLRYCKLNHGVACSGSVQAINAPGMKVIDCEKSCVVFYEPQMPYVALSHVWGAETGSDSRPEHCLPPEPLNNSEAGATLPGELPVVVNDAIEVTKNLSLRYLWVDRYCIDQDNPVEKHDQIQKMNLIYTGAELYIVAAAGDDGAYGLPGVASRSRRPQPFAKVQAATLVSTLGHPHCSISTSKWASRGWTYQEAVLSRRKLVFTDHQAYFKCNVMNSYESFSAPLDVLHHTNRSAFHFFLRPAPSCQ